MRRYLASPYLLLALIVLVGAGLRLYDYRQLPLSNDELSALSRLNFDSLDEVIEQGIKPDGHPAGVQVFLYFWTRWGGTSESWLRLPFLLLSLISIPMLYELGRHWIHPTAGLFAAAALACWQYPIMHSLAARPYAMGLFATLGLLLCWTEWVKAKEKIPWTWVLGFVLFGALCAYTHYFALLLLGLVGLAGIGLVGPKFRRAYLLANAGIFLLYLPHLPIFFAQLSTGGIGGWLAPPGLDFPGRYLAYLVHYSFLLGGLVLLMILVGIRLQKPIHNRWRWLALGGFLLSLGIGYSYSIWASPVLHFAVLYFAFPLLLLFVFSFLPNLAASSRSVSLLWLGLTLFMALSIWTLIENRQHYRLFYQGGVAGVVKQALDWQEKAGPGAHVLQLNHPDYARYYYEKWQDSLTHPLYELPEPIAFRKWLHAQESDYLSLGWVAKALPMEYLALVEEEYPYRLEQQRHFISEGYVWAKTQQGPAPRSTDFISICDFSTSHAYWQFSPESVFVDSLLGNTFRLSPDQEFGPTFQASLGELSTDRFPCLFASVQARLPERDRDQAPSLVLSLEKNGAVRYWHEVPFQRFIAGTNQWEWVHLALRIRHTPAWTDSEMQVKVYVWNKSGSTAEIATGRIQIDVGNPDLYGLIEPL